MLPLRTQIETTMVYEFIAHISPGRSRIFALVKGAPNRLDAVTSLGADCVQLTDELAAELNEFLATRRESGLTAVLERLPAPVRQAVGQYVRIRCPDVLGAFNPYGPIDVLREAWFGPIDQELEDYVEGAYTIGLGVRMTNEVDEKGTVSWMVQVRSDEAMLPASAPLRSWPLPEGVTLLRTWPNSAADTGGVTAALAVAAAGSAEGRMVRVHTLFQSRDEDPDGGGTSQVVVEVFEAPIPSRDDERP
jgi:hypothetical protein